MRKNTPAEIRFAGILLLVFGIFFVIFGFALVPELGFQYMGIAVSGIGIIILIVRAVKDVQIENNDRILQEQLLRDGVSSIDNLTPYEFEEWIARLMRAKGYNAYTTKYSGDYGIDVIAEKEYTKIGIQVKKFHKPVGVKAIQEVIAGMQYYDCNIGWVVTSANGFTQAAINLAQKSGVVLLTKNDIAKLIQDSKK